VITARGIRLSWQVVPRVLIEMLNDRDAMKSKRVMIGWR